MVTRYAAFLRGVNVNGVNLKMSAVAQTLRDAGFTDVSTVLASGNVLLSSHVGAAAARREAERSLRDGFGYDAWVLVYDLDTVAAISAAFPFEREVAERHSYVTFASDPEMHDELSALAQRPGPEEQIQPGDGVVYWQVPRAATLTSEMGKTMGKKRYKSSTTTRNLRTIDKVLRGWRGAGQEN